MDGGLDSPRLTVSVRGARRAAVVDAAVAARLHGLRPTRSPRPFEMLVGSVCAQQVNLTFAFTVRARLVRRFGEALLVGGQAVYAFPEPAVLARADVAELRRMQFAVREAEYVVGLAQRVAAGELDLDSLQSLSNNEVIERLTTVRGFGRWSAEWFLARCLGRGDICPAGALGVRRAFEHFYARGRAIREPAIRRRAARGSAFQNGAVHYLLAGRRLMARAAAGGRA
jgi:DNA-3-methyladenine glycosylase II